MVSDTNGTADVLDSGITRNLLMKENYGVDVRELPVPQKNQRNSVENAIKADIVPFDIAMVNMENVPAIALGGYCYDLTKLNYVSLEKVWWDQSANVQLRMGQKLFYTYSDMDTTHFDAVRCIFFNQVLAQNNQIDPNDLYSLALDGVWTLAEMYEISKDTYIDNDASGKASAEDIFPMLGVPSTSMSALLSGFDSSYVKMDESTGFPYANFLTERFVDCYNEIMRVMHTPNFFWSGTSTNVAATEMFIKDQGLFLLTP